MEQETCAIVAAVVQAFGRGEAVVESWASRPYFTVFYEGDEVLLTKQLLVEIESRLGQPLVAVVSIGLSKAWPKDLAKKMLETSTSWKLAKSATEQCLLFEEWSEEYCAANAVSLLTR